MCQPYHGRAYQFVVRAPRSSTSSRGYGTDVPFLYSQVLWATAAEILVQGLRTLRTLHGTAARAPTVLSLDNDALVFSLNTLANVMGAFTPRSPLFGPSFSLDIASIMFLAADLLILVVY